MPKGLSPKEARERRARLAKEAAELRAQGLSNQEVGDRLGVTRSYASALVCDPDGSKLRARRKKYAKPCVECGKPTSPHGRVENKSGRCNACLRGTGLHLGMTPSQWSNRRLDPDSCWRSDCDGPRDCPEHADQLARIRAEFKGEVRGRGRKRIAGTAGVQVHDENDLAAAAA